MFLQSLDLRFFTYKAGAEGVFDDGGDVPAGVDVLPKVGAAARDFRNLFECFLVFPFVPGLCDVGRFELELVVAGARDFADGTLEAGAAEGTFVLAVGHDGVAVGGVVVLDVVVPEPGLVMWAAAGERAGSWFRHCVVRVGERW